MLYAFYIGVFEVVHVIAIAEDYSVHSAKIVVKTIL
jgi:hypothetical protein